MRRFASALVVVAVVAAGVMASPQDAVPPDQPAETRIRFNFKGAPFDQVLDFFSRASGMPVVKETGVPEGTLDYLSLETYDLDEALHVLNIILQARGVMLRVEGDMLYLQKLEDMQRENIPTYFGTIPAEVTDDQIVTVVRPLEIAIAKPLAERLSTLVASYGAVSSLDQQNALVITETAAQVRRLTGIIEQLDREDPEGSIRIFAIRNAQATTLMEPLKALLAVKVEKYIVDKDGKQTKIEEDQMSGLSMTADARTNSIIAKGAQSRIDKLAETIALLDVPATHGGRSIHTSALAVLSPADAAKQLNKLYVKQPEDQRPIIVPRNDAGTVTIVGTETAIREARQLLEEIDGGDAVTPSATRGLEVIELTHARADVVIGALKSLLTPRQQAVVRLVPGPGGNTVILSAAPEDLASVKSTITALDRPARGDRQVRLLRVAADDPVEVLLAARALYDRQSDPQREDDDLEADLDDRSGVLTLVGPGAAIERFAGILRQVESNLVVERETRRIDLRHAVPSRIASQVSTLARPLLEPRDGRTWQAPQIDPVDALDLLVVTAAPEQFRVLDTVIDTLDRPGPGDYQFQVIPLAGLDDPDALLERAANAFTALARGQDDADEITLPELEVDRLSGNLVVTGGTRSVELYARALGEARRLLPPQRTGRMIRLHQARAADVAMPLVDLLDRSSPVDPARRVPPPEVTVIERTNSLYIVAEPVQHQLVAQYVRDLDTWEPSEQPPLRLLQVRAADSGQIANLLRQRYTQRPREMQREKPVSISADAGTNTLIVVAHEDVFDEIKTFVEEVNEAGESGSERETKLYPLKRARAQAVAQALDKLYPAPPVPRDRRGRPLWHLQEPKEVHITADPGTNAIIVDAPRQRQESLAALVEQLDRVELPPTAEMRAYAVHRGDANQISRILSDLARRGALSAEAEDGSAVEVSIQVEPKSNSLIVTGDELTFRKTEELLAELDAVPQPRQVRAITIRHGNLDDIADRATRLFREQSGDDPAAATLEVEVDPAGGALLVVGEDDALRRFTTIVDQLVSAAGPAPSVALVPLQHADADEMVRWLETMAEEEATLLGDPVGPAPVFRAVPRTNSVLVAAVPERQAVYRSLIQSQDVTRPGAVPPLRVLTVRTADAVSLAAALARQYDRRPADRRATDPVTISADTRTNALLVSANDDTLAEIRGIVDELNATAGAGVEMVEMKAFALKHARAESVAPIIEDLLRKEAALPEWMLYDLIRRGRTVPEGPPDVRVSADPRLNAVVIAGPLSVLQVAGPLIEQLDVAPTQLAGVSDRSVQVLVIENAEASALAANLEALFDESEQTGRPPTIRVDQASNSLIIRATNEQFATIEGVVATVDRATIAATRQVRTIPLDPGRASAAEVAATLQRLLERGSSKVQVITLEELLEEDAKELSDDTSSALPLPRAAWMTALAMAATPKTQASSLEPQASDSDSDSDSDDLSTITIAVDPETNSLIVVGSPRATERIEALAKQVQAQIPAAPGTVRVIAMPESTNTGSFARLVNAALARLTPAGGRPGDFRRRVSVFSDAATNSLVVVANDRDFETVKDLIGSLARPPAGQSMHVKRYPLRTITVDRALRSVQALLGDDGRRRGRQATRVRQLAVTLLDEDESIEAVFDPAHVRLTPDAVTNSLIVMAPPRAVEFLDRYVELIDQTSVNTQSTLKVYALEHAQAPALENSLRRIFRSRYRSRQRTARVAAMEPEFVSDRRTNTLLVTASPEDLAEIDTLMADLDRRLGDAMHPLRTIELTAARPQEAARLLEQVVIGSDQARRSSTLIVPDNNSGILLVRADETVSAEIDAVLAEIDRDATAQFEIRTITLERADASSVATALQRFFEDRARVATSGRGRRGQNRRVSIIGDSTSRTILVAASDDDFAKIQELVAKFDTPEAAGSLAFRVFELEHAQASEIQLIVQQLVNDLMWNQGPWWVRPRGGQSSMQDRVAVRADERLNVLVVTGDGDKFDLVESVIEVLDAPVPMGQQRVVRMHRIEHADVDLVAELVREVFTDTSRAQRWWEPQDRTELKIRVDPVRRLIIVAGSETEQDEVADLIASLDDPASAGPEQTAEVIAVEYARADELANILRRFLRDRSRATSAPDSTATVVASRSANSLVISAAGEEMALLRDLLGQLDRPDISGQRSIEIVALEDGDAAEIARIVRAQFSRRRGDQGVVVTADARTNSIIINAPREQFAQAQALIERLDSPEATDETIIRTYTLDGARADEAVRLLTETLQLDDSGRAQGITVRLEELEGPPVQINAHIVADRRSNSLIVTATEDSFPVIETLIKRVDTVDAVSPRDWRIVTLEHAKAYDVYLTLREFFRDRGRGDEPAARIDYNRVENQLIIAASPDQFEQIDSVIKQIDIPSPTKRTTEFVPLRFAEAEKVQEALSFFYGRFAPGAETPAAENVTIVADPATNSLVISADDSQWDDIRTLLAELDSEQYDASLQLRVIPLTWADASSVARAINDAFSGTLQRDREASRALDRAGRGDRERDGERRGPETPTVLVESQDWVRASAEPQTNSVIISASRHNLEKVERIIAELDVADYARMPPPQIIPVGTGDPQRLAESLRTLFAQATAHRGGDTGGRVRIVGDPVSNTIIVRAREEDYAQIRALAEALQQEASGNGLSVRVVRLAQSPARRVAEAITPAFQAKAAAASQPLSIQVDSTGNSLIVASTAALADEIESTAGELDAMAPGRGQGIFIIELEHVSPEAAIEVIKTMGLDRQGPGDSATRIISEPIKVSTLRGRHAIVVAASPGDRDTIVGLLKALDATPELAETQMRIVALHHAEATALARILAEVLDPAEQQAGTPLANAVREQVRRLAVRRDGLDEPDLDLDLTKPIRLIPDAGTNSIIISSTETNVVALEELVSLFDSLPVTDAVTVQIFPLENISANEFSRIVRDLFSQGKTLGTIPGTNLRGLPQGLVGPALLDEVAISVDERTNTVIVAGKTEAVALVEVLTQRLDNGRQDGWIEPRLVQLRHADAESLAEMLRAVLVDGVTNLPQATPLQRQIGRLRLARADENGGRVIESDVFQPMDRLVIHAESQLNALLLVGTPMNLEAVGELITMLDVEAASPSSTVRIYPVEHASAARLARTITALFDQQVVSKAIRPEDRVIVQADDRTNALIVTTSPRSFAVLEGLLTSLDSEIAPDLREIRTLELENADAGRLAQMIQELMDARLERLRRVQPETAELERATIVADDRTNRLMVAAGNESFEVIQRLAEEMDIAALIDRSLVEVIAVQDANVDRLADTINDIMERRYADVPDDVRRSQRPLVLTDPRTSSLLVAAGPEDLRAVQDLVARLDEAPINPAVGMHIIQLESTRADVIAPRLQRLMRDRQQTLGDAETPSDRVTIEPDAGSNSLIVAATEENAAIVRSLIESLERSGVELIEGEGAGDLAVIQIMSGDCNEVVDLLDDLYVAEENRRRGANTIRVTADDRSNSLLVNAPPPDLRRIRDLVAKLDGTKPASIVEIKYIPLSSANALETVSLIENVLSGRGIGSRRGQGQAIVLKYLHRMAGVEGDLQLDEIEVNASIRESIILTPDVRTNTIIVTAPRDSMSMIEQMIRDLDASSVGAQSIRIFKLANADASAMAQILTELFSLTRQGNLYVLRPRELGAPAAVPPAPGVAPAMAPGVTLGGTELTAVPDERQQLSITVDSRTNSLLVSGTPTYLDLVEEVVEELDAQEASERMVFSYPLRNSSATEVADVVRSFVDTEQQKLISTLGTDQIGSAARLLEREVTIVDDAKTNSVLVSVSPRYAERIRGIIDELDVDPPQVLIQVLLAEVTLTSDTSWGFEASLSTQIGGLNVNGGYNMNRELGLQSGLGPLSPNISIGTSDFSLLLRALQAQGRLQVLSNPSVVTANNEAARIQVGQTLRLPTSTSFDLGSQQTAVEPVEVGVILQVEPSINPDGFVRLQVEPEISELSSETTQISEDFESPIINQRRAQTVVTVRDGQTIVIGGLLSDRYERRESKIPLIGDIPILGMLFRAESTVFTKTEFLIVLTPYVIDSPAEIDIITESEVGRYSVPEELKKQLRKSRLEGVLFDDEGNPIDTDEWP